MERSTLQDCPEEQIAHHQTHWPRHPATTDKRATQHQRARSHRDVVQHTALIRPHHPGLQAQRDAEEKERVELAAFLTIQETVAGRSASNEPGSRVLI